jgi:ATP-dependent protease ClpP protease subunit
LLIPNVNYRPDPSRAIYVDGLLDDKLLSRLTPLILRLQAQNRKPITAYILDSPGGNTSIMHSILHMLRLSDQNSSTPCRLITVATTKAASAAADLLSSGDYAIAFPGCSLLYHGVRTPGLIPALQPLTAERTSLLAHILRLTNDAFAMELVKRTEKRFVFRFIFSRPKFEEVRAKNPNKVLSDLDCFMEVVSEKLSFKATKVFKKAQERYARYEPLLANLTTKGKPDRRKNPVKVEAARIKAIVDFEVAENKPNPGWTFKDGGLTRLAEDFFLIAEYLESQQSERIKYWCGVIGQYALSKEELAEIDKITDESAKNEALTTKVQPYLQPLWSFFVALCHALQEDDNELTAEDAYWLGLIDEVMSDTSLLTERWFEEWREDPPPAPKDTDEEGKVKANEKADSTTARP